MYNYDNYHITVIIVITERERNVIMARKLVEYDDVAAAAQRLKDAGKRPTLIAVRDLIGKGSGTVANSRW